MTVPQANLQIYQGSLFTVTIPGGGAAWGVRMQLRSAPADQNGIVSVTLTTGGGGIVWNGTGFTATITPTQSNAMSLLSGVWDCYGDPDGVPDNATVILEFGEWSMRPFVTAESVVPQPPSLSPNIGDTIEWNGTQWAPVPSIDLASSIIYRQGAASSGRFVQTWAEVASAIAASVGVVTILVDASLVGGVAHVPGASGVTECFGRTIIMPADSAFGSNTKLVIDDGATLRNLARVSGDIIVSCDCRSTTPSLDWDWTQNNQFALSDDADIAPAATATHACVSVPAGKSFTMLSHLFSQVGANAGSVPFITVAATGSILISALGSIILDNIVGGAGDFTLYYDDETAFWTGQDKNFVQAGLVALMPNLTGKYLSTKQTPNSYVVDFVSDCGADPTGVNSSSAAFDSAANILTTLAANPDLPIKSLTLVFPPGRYKHDTTLATPVWNFLNKGTTVTILGHGDASVIEYHGPDGPTVANAYRIYMRDVTCWGTSVNDFTYDCSQAWNLSASHVGSVERCKFGNLLTSYVLLQLTGNGWTMRDCEIFGCGTTAATRALVWSYQTSYIKLENCSFTDVGQLNGYAMVVKTDVNQCWLRHDDSLAIGSGYKQRGVVIEGCLFDEGCNRGVNIVGGPTANISEVVIRNTAFNTPILPGGIGSLLVSNVDYLEIDSMQTTGTLVTTNVPQIVAVSVGRTKITDLVVTPADAARYISFDSGCKLLEIVESNIATVDVHSAAIRTTIDSSGVKADMFTTGAAVTANQLVKMTSTGIQTLATGDATNLLFGVTQDSAGAGSVNVRVARKDQRVTVLSDGATTIAQGDQITNSAATAGQVKKGASNVIGIALTAATNVGGTAFDIQLL